MPGHANGDAFDVRKLIPQGYHPWLLAPAPRPEGLTAVCESIILVDVVLPDGSKGSYVPVFTEAALAERFVELLGDDWKQLKPFSCPTFEELVLVLRKLMELGNTHLGVNPESDHCESLVPISTVIDAISGQGG
jgi:hypothetical protein